MQFRFDNDVIAVNTPSAEALLAELDRRLRAGEGAAVATLNLDHLVKLSRDPGFRRVYAAQDLVVADGNPIVWLSRLAGRPVALAPGSDLVMQMTRVAAECGVPVALIGSTEDALLRAARRMRQALPGLDVALCRAPPFGFDPHGAEAGALLDEIRQSGAHLCLLALGAPRQEALAARGRAEVPGVCFASIGAGLDFIAGTQRRAPRIVRALALEWLWRALSKPGRLGPRYLRCLAILPRQVGAALRQRRHAG